MLARIIDNVATPSLLSPHDRDEGAPISEAEVVLRVVVLVVAKPEAPGR